MIKPENIIEKRDKGSYKIRCERCGKVFAKSRIDDRINPICGRCWREDERIKNKERAEAKKKADYDKAFNDGMEYAIEQLIKCDLTIAPCQYVDVPDEFCENKCPGFADDKKEYTDCWINALKKRWFE